MTQRRAVRVPPRARGFTLVEILVALAIVAIASAAAWLAWRGAGDASLRREAVRFAGAIEHAAERAQWRREELALSAGPDGWRFWHRGADRREWVPLIGDDLLAERRLPDGVAFASVRVAGRDVAPGTVVPFRANGRNDPSSFVLAAGDARVQVSVDPLNRVAVSGPPQ